MKNVCSKNGYDSLVCVSVGNGDLEYKLNFKNVKFISSALDYAIYNIVDAYYIDILKNKEYNGYNLKNVLNELGFDFNIDSVEDIKDFERLNDKFKNILVTNDNLDFITLNNKEIGFIKDSLLYFKIKLDKLINNEISVDKYNNSNVYNKLLFKYKQLSDLQYILA